MDNIIAILMSIKITNSKETFRRRHGQPKGWQGFKRGLDTYKSTLRLYNDNQKLFFEQFEEWFNMEKRMKKL